MAKELATKKDNEPMKIFQDKISAKIRSDIGDLMPDDMLQKLVSDAIHAELYRDVAVKRSYGKHEPLPWIQSIVRDQVESKLKQYVDQQIEQHYEKLHDMVVEQVKENGSKVIGDLILSAVRGHVTGLETALSSAIMNRAY